MPIEFLSKSKNYPSLPKGNLIIISDPPGSGSVSTFRHPQSWGPTFQLYNRLLLQAGVDTNNLRLGDDNKYLLCGYSFFLINRAEIIALFTEQEYDVINKELITTPECRAHIAEDADHLIKLAPRKALLLLEALAKNDPNTMNRLGLLYSKGVEAKNSNLDIAPDPKKAFKWFSEHEKHSPCLLAYLNLGACYYYGRGIEKGTMSDDTRYNYAYAYLRKALKQPKGNGTESALFYMGRMQILGRGTRINLGLAQENLTQALELLLTIKNTLQNKDDIHTNTIELRETYFWLGKAWEGKDQEQADKYFKEAEKLGYCFPKNETELPLPMEEKSILESDYDKALKIISEKKPKWQERSLAALKKAAKDNTEAQYQLFIYYSQGIGIKQKDPLLANEWLLKAAANRHYKARLQVTFNFVIGLAQKLCGKRPAAKKIEPTPAVMAIPPTKPAKLAQSTTAVVVTLTENKDSEEPCERKSTKKPKKIGIKSLATTKKPKTIIESPLLIHVKKALESKNNEEATDYFKQLSKKSHTLTITENSEIQTILSTRAAEFCCYLFDTYENGTNLFNMFLPGFLQKIKKIAGTDDCSLESNWVKNSLASELPFGLVDLALSVYLDFLKFNDNEFKQDDWDTLIVTPKNALIASKYGIHLEDPETHSQLKEMILSLHQRLKTKKTKTLEAKEELFSEIKISEQVEDKKYDTTDHFFKPEFIFSPRAEDNIKYEFIRSAKPVMLPNIVKEILTRFENLGYKACLVGSRAYDPPQGFEVITRDIDLVTNAPATVVSSVMQALQLANIRNIGNDKLAVPMFFATLPLLGTKIDLRYNANLPDDLIGHDLLLRSKYIDKEGWLYTPQKISNKNKLLTDEAKRLSFSGNSKKIFTDDASLLLVVIFFLSKGYTASDKIMKNFQEAVKTNLSNLVQKNPERLLSPLARNFTRGSSQNNFELLVKHGVWDALFPHTLPIQKRPQVQRFLTTYFGKCDQFYQSLQNRDWRTVNDSINNFKRQLYDGIIIAELLETLLQSSSPAKIAEKLKDIFKHSPLLSVQYRDQSDKALIKKAAQLSNLYLSWNPAAFAKTNYRPNLFNDSTTTYTYSSAAKPTLMS